MDVVAEHVKELLVADQDMEVANWLIGDGVLRVRKVRRVRAEVVFIHIKYMWLR